MRMDAFEVVVQSSLIIFKWNFTLQLNRHCTAKKKISLRQVVGQNRGEGEGGGEGEVQKVPDKNLARRNRPKFWEATTTRRSWTLAADFVTQRKLSDQVQEQREHLGTAMTSSKRLGSLAATFYSRNGSLYWSLEANFFNEWWVRPIADLPKFWGTR